MVEDVGWFPVDGPQTARRAVLDWAERLGFDAKRVGELAIVIAEIGSNLHKHADGGWIALRCLRQAGVGGLEIVAIDSGPGMDDALLSGEDGHSTAGTLGIGLGAIRRLSDRVDLYSQPGRGTVLVAQVWPTGARPVLPSAAGISRPITGETVCGDQFAIRSVDGGLLVLVADGLGHGPLANAAGAAAVEVFLETPLEAPEAIIERLHRGMSHTRGAAAAVALIGNGAVRYAGLGNIAGTIAYPDGERRNMVSMPGIVGHQSRTVRAFDYPLEPAGIVVLHSDGVSDRWGLLPYPGLSRREPLTVAATLLRDAGVRRDDACVLVVRP